MQELRELKPVSLSQEMYSVFEQLTGSAEQARIQMRAVQVEDAYQTAVQNVFGRAAALVLKRTNAVYCFEEKGVTQFVVYSDDSGVRSSLDARQGLLKIDLFKQGIDFMQFKVLPAQRSIKNRHPFENAVVARPKARLRELTAEELAEVDKFVSSVEDKGVREALRQAVISDLRAQSK